MKSAKSKGNSSFYNLDTNRNKISYNPLLRLKLVSFLILLWTAFLVFRLLSLQVLNPEKWIEWANRQHTSKIQIAAQRGKILDRNGLELAVSVPASSIFVRPAEFEHKDLIVKVLAEELRMEPELIAKKLESESPFIWIKRQIHRHIAEKILAYNLKGVGEIEEARRVYPFAQSASTLIGKVGIDGNGLSGLESIHERLLSPEKLEVSVYKDALGKKIIAENFNHQQVVGENLQLTLDAEFQQFASKELEKVVIEHKAKRAIAVLLNAKSGEVIALGQAPSENFNLEKVSSREAFFNYALQGSYEPGSTMKPMVAAMALNLGAVTIDEIFNTENGRFRIGRRTVKDVHGSSQLSVRDIVVQSSNIGMSKIAFKMGKENLYKGLRDFGFGQSTKLGVPGEAAGILRHMDSWAEIDIATHSFGQGVAVTAMQLTRAFAALVNGGFLPNLTLIANIPITNKQVLTPEVSTQMRDTLVAVVEQPNGTGKNAKIPGLIVGGKTGTAQKAKTDGRGYASGAYIASFMGFADGQKIGIDENFVLLVMVDEPHGSSIYGGTVAAPVFRRIMKNVFYTLAMRKKL